LLLSQCQHKISGKIVVSYYVKPMRNYQGLNIIFLLMMVFAGVTGASFVWLWREPSFVPVVAIISSIVGWIFSIKAYYRPYKGDDIRLTSKVDLLNSVETELNHLIKFIQNQRDEVLNNEKILFALKKEYDELKPIVDSKRDLVQAIITQINRTNRARKIYGYIASFLLGFASSLLASYVFGLFKSN
jgi:hypothetical protein